MYDIDKVLKIAITSFEENVYEYETLDIEDFLDAIDLNLSDINVEEHLHYDENILKKYKNKAKKQGLKQDGWEYAEVMFASKKAFENTLSGSEEISINTFLDNLVASLYSY